MIEQNESFSAPPSAFEEHHYHVRHWSRRWGYSEKGVRVWFRDEYGPVSLWCFPSIRIASQY